MPRPLLPARHRLAHSALAIILAAAAVPNAAAVGASAQEAAGTGAAPPPVAQGPVPPAIRPPTAAEKAQIAEWTGQAQEAFRARRWDEAERLARQTMAIEERTYGPRHPEVAGSLNSIAAIAHAQGRYAEAEPLFSKALEIRQAVLGERHPDTATSYNTVALNLNAQGRYAEAETLFQKGLQIRQAVLGERHRDTAASYNNLAYNLNARGLYAEAELLYRKALEIFQAVLGGQHPDTAASYNNVAFNLDSQGRFAEGEPLYRKALEIFQGVLGERHPSTATSYNNVASNLDYQGRYAEAEPLYRKALEIRQAVLGSQHPDTAASYNNVAFNLNAQLRYAEAETLDRKALEIREAVLGEQHPATAASYNNLAANLNAQARYAEAETPYRKAIEINRVALGERHPTTAASYNNLASNLNAQGRHAEAEPLYRKALEIRQAVFGERHPSMAASYNNLASNLNARGRYADAETLAWRAVGIVRGQRLQERQADRSGVARPAAHSDGLTYAFNVYLRSAAGLAASSPTELARVRAAAFAAAQDLDTSSAGQALAQAAARVVAGQAGLAETVRRRQDLAVMARGYDARLLQALSSGDQATAAAMRAELARSGQELSRLDAEIRARFPRYAELVSPEALSVGAVQQRLARREGLILIVPSGGDVHVFAVSKTQIAWNRVEGGAKGVAEAVAALRCDVDPVPCSQAGSAGVRGAAGAFGTAVSSGGRAFDQSRAYGLYRDLVAPVEGALAGVETLYVTASGPLSGLPLGLLFSEAPPPGHDADPQTLAGAKWLADRYALITLPSVSSLRALGALQVTSGRLALSGFGDPVLEGPAPSETSRGAVRIFRSVSSNGQPLADGSALGASLAPLPGTRVELTAMAQALGAPTSSLHMGSAATESAVKTSADLAHARVVIFATHGLLPRELKGLEEPGLVFTPPAAATAEDDGVLTASEAARLNLTAEWVILSACNTAAADGTPGAESLSGLAKAFLYAGAQALLASHWRVADDSTSALTVQTLAIQKANPSFSKAQALQAAMKAVRTGALPDGSPLPGWKPQWAHPAAWAPFTLVSAGE